MAKTNAKKKDKEKNKGKKKTKSITWLLVVLSILMAVVFKLGFLFFVIGMLPSIVSYYVDATRNNLTFQTVFTCNLAGILPFMAQMLTGDGGNAAVQNVITDATNWLIVYSTAGLGWVFILIAPLLSHNLVVAINKRQIGRLRAHQEELVSEWGSELESYLKQPDEQ